MGIVSIHGNGYGDGYGNGYGNGYGDGDSNGEIIIDHKTPIIAYHFVPNNGKLRYPHAGINHEIKTGLILEQYGKLELCSKGLHASLTIKDARKFCDGILCKVACSGRVIISSNKLVCERREILEIMD